MHNAGNYKLMAIYKELQSLKERQKPESQIKYMYYTDNDMNFKETLNLPNLSTEN